MLSPPDKALLRRALYLAETRYKVAATDRSLPYAQMKQLNLVPQRGKSSIQRRDVRAPRIIDLALDGGRHGVVERSVERHPVRDVLERQQRLRLVGLETEVDESVEW